MGQDSGTDPKNVRLRNQFRSATNATHGKAKAANELIDTVLGGTAPQKRQNPLEFLTDPRTPELPPDMKDVIEWFTQLYPSVGNRVRGVYSLPPGNVVGRMNQMGGMGLQPVKSVNDPEFKSTILHELSHLAGLHDGSSSFDSSPVSAYDIDDAALAARADIELPAERFHAKLRKVK